MMGKKQHYGGCKQGRSGNACHAEKPSRREPSRCTVSYWGVQKGTGAGLKNMMAARELGEDSGMGGEGVWEGGWETYGCFCEQL